MIVLCHNGFSHHPVDWCVEVERTFAAHFHHFAARELAQRHSAQTVDVDYIHSAVVFPHLGSILAAHIFSIAF